MNDATQNGKAKGRGLIAWEGFEAELQQREQAIAGLLPAHVNKARFFSSAIAAVKQTPALLTASPRSLFAAIAKSAQDGLIPDGREGVITIYREKQKDDTWENVAQWNPMIYGLRKRARELDDIIINSQVVHEHDHFVREEGDNPHIEHQPAQLGQPRGKMIGAYAIFRNESGILHREVMDADQIEGVRAQSKAPNSLMWTKFVQEAWRKTVVRRGIKSVPCSEPLETIVRRDDDLFNFEAEQGNGKAKRPPPNVIQPPAEGERKALPPVVGEPVVVEAEWETVDTLLTAINELPSLTACVEWGFRNSGNLGHLSEEEANAVTKALLARQYAITKLEKKEDSQERAEDPFNEIPPMLRRSPPNKSPRLNVIAAG